MATLTADRIRMNQCMEFHHIHLNAKQLKDTVTKYTHTYDKIQRHQKVKKSRRESKKRIDEEMSII